MAVFERTGTTLKQLDELKVILASMRKKDLTPAQFKEASLKGYAKAESKALMESGIQKIVASFAVPEKDKNPAFDVMLEIYFATSDELKAAFASPVIGMLRKDEETLVQLDARAFVAQGADLVDVGLPERFLLGGELQVLVQLLDGDLERVDARLRAGVLVRRPALAIAAAAAPSAELRERGRGRRHHECKHR